MTGYVTAAVANYGMRHPEKWLYPPDVIPELAHLSVEKKPRINRKKAADNIRAFFTKQTIAPIVTAATPTQPYA